MHCDDNEIGPITKTEENDEEFKDIADSVRNILKELGEDPERQGLQKTPLRVAKSLKFLTNGYNVNLKELINDAIFDANHDEMVIVKDIPIFSLCEHHMLPFFGKAHIGYIPKDKVIGLSKMARIAEMYARRLQIQERLTAQIAEAVMESIEPVGVSVVIEAHHMCMSMRGALAHNSSTTTSSVMGVFRDDPRSRAEFFSLLKKS